ncbi:WAGO-2 protein [Aphelenchoides avenae]|nr:WAGO-2 protein [Aphelenchus avenae]
MITVGRQVRRESENTLVASGVAIPETISMAEKKSPCTLSAIGEQAHLTTNMWLLSANDVTVYKYDVDFKGIQTLDDGQTRVVSFTKRSSDSVQMLDRKDKVRVVFKGLIIKYHAFFGGPVFCDLQSLLYTTTDLPFERLYVEAPPVRPTEHTFDDLTLDDINQVGAFNWPFARFRVTLKRARGTLNPSDIERFRTNNPTEEDRSLRQFMELATSHHLQMHPREHVVFPVGTSYLIKPLEHGFTPADMLVRNGRNQLDPRNETYLAIGAHKSVRLVDGPTNTGSCVLVVETKKTAFHMPGSLLAKVTAMLVPPATLNTIANNAPFLHHLTRKFGDKYVVTPFHNEVNRQGGASPVQLRLFVSSTSLTMFFTVRDREVSLFNYFLDAHNYEIRHPNAPLAQVLVRGRTVYYPIELLELTDNQRLQTAEADPALLCNMNRVCAPEPQKLLEHTKKNLEALNLANPDLGALGIRTHGPLELTAAVLDSPTLQYGNVEVKPHQGKWQTSIAKYVRPTHMRTWAAVYVSTCGDIFTEHDFRKFVQAYKAMAERKGITVDPPLQIQIPADERAFKAKMAELSALQVEFVLFAHGNADRFVHDMMKWAEVRYGFITQDLRIKTCLDVVRGLVLTLENIVNKTNVKLGGLNFTLDRNDRSAVKMLEGVLYLGFGMNHPNGGRGKNKSGRLPDSDTPRHCGPPSVVGFCANCSVDSFEFVGDFMFQEARRDEKVSVIATIVDRCLEQYHRNRQSLPKRIVLFRNGCAEGQFADILKYEVPLVVHAIQTVTNKYGGEAAKLTVIVPNKMHNVRFFPNPIPSGGAQDQNVRPGTTIDHTVTSMNHREFYLNAHTTIQGTAKVPRYTVLYDQNEISSENLQRLVYWLCHCHQIVALSTSLPAPVHVAKEYAKRGRNIYNSVTRAGDENNHGDDAGDRYKGMTYEELNAALTYWNGPGGLAMDYRTNA